MLFFYEGWSKTPCIYEIRNTHNDRRYVGQTQEPKNRWIRGHKESLLRNVHKNQYLQNDFNKCFRELDHTDFLEFHILEALPDSTPKTRNTKELRWIKRQRKVCELYNLVEEQNGHNSHTEATKLKISLTKKTYYQTEKGRELIDRLGKQKQGKSYEDLYGEEKAAEIRKKISDNKLIEMNRPEVKENLRRQLVGKTNIERYGAEKAQQVKQRMSKARKGKFFGKPKTYVDIKLMSPDGHLFNEVICLKDFAEKHHISRNHLSELLSGKRKSHKGWRLFT